MGEQSATSGIPGWLKAAGSSIFGLVSGAVLMYVTPLVNSAVKPPDPVANFGYQAQGLAVTFQNRSTGATDGWWDFGDGSALEPFMPQQAALAHTYAKPGNYNVRLSLSNLFNEKNDRSVTINLDGGAALAPAVEQFLVVPKSPSMCTPAVFQLIAKARNAEALVWTYDGCKPIEVSSDTGGVQERWVTVSQPGTYTFRVVAVGGKQTVEAAAPTQWVGMPQSNDAPMAKLTVTYDAVHVDRQENVAVPIRLAWKHDCRDNICPTVTEWAPAKPGYQIVRAEVDGNGKDVKIRGVPRVEIAPDRGKLTVSGEMIRPSGLLSHLMPPPHQVPLRVTLEKRSKATPRTFEMPMWVNVPGQTVIPIPTVDGNWQTTKRQITLDLVEGPRKIWSGSDMPANRPMQLQGHPVVLSATVQNNQIVLTVVNQPVSLPTPRN